MIGNLKPAPSLGRVLIEVNIALFVESVVNRSWSRLAEIVVYIRKAVARLVKLFSLELSTYRVSIRSSPLAAMIMEVSEAIQVQSRKSKAWEWELEENRILEAILSGRALILAGRQCHGE